MTGSLLTLLNAPTLAAYTAAGYWGDETLYAVAARHARATPDAFAVRDRHRRLTYAELVEAADRLAASLAGHGLDPGQRVAVLLPGRVETAIALIACSRNFYVCCPSLHRGHTVGEVVALVDRVRAAALIAEPGYGADADRHDIFAALADRDFLRVAWRIGPADAVPFGELVVHDLQRGASLIDRLEETGAVFLFGVPTHAVDLIGELRARGQMRLGVVRGFRISGAAAPAAVVAELMRYGVMPQSGYGMTETCSHQYTLPDDTPEQIVETSGRACEGYEIRIWREDNPDIAAAPGEIGEIGGRGASLMLGYFDDQIATEAAFNALGWFMTGDLGWLDDQGYLRITGRKKDVIIRGGRNIHPAHIEALALRHEAVEKAAAFPLADPRLGERICLAVVLRANLSLDPNDILQHLDQAGLSPYDMPEFILPLTEMPLTASGKIIKRELLRWVDEGRVQPQPVRSRSSEP